MEIPGGCVWGGGHQRPPGTENPGGWGLQIKKSSLGGGGVWIFSGTTQYCDNFTTTMYPLVHLLARQARYYLYAISTANDTVISLFRKENLYNLFCCRLCCSMEWEVLLLI